MSLKINKSQRKEYKKVPEGTHIGIPVDIIDFGYQFKTEWPSGDKVISERTGDPVLNQQILINFEFPAFTDEFDGVEKPLYLGKVFPMSVRDDGESYVHEKSGLMSLILAANPEAEVLTDIIGKPLNITVGLTDTGNPKVTATVASPSEFVLDGKVVKREDLKLFNESKIYSMEDGKSELYESLPDWITEKIDNQANALTPKF